MISFVGQTIKFLKDVVNDPRIPTRDKQVLLALVGLLVSPMDLIPDWIPVFGQLDDIVILSIVLDYFFKVLDSQILLSHYPWGMKSFARLRRLAGLSSLLVPSFLKRKIWTYVKDPHS